MGVNVQCARISPLLLRLIPGFESVGQNIYRKMTSRDKYSADKLSEFSVESW